MKNKLLKIKWDLITLLQTNKQAFEETKDLYIANNIEELNKIINKLDNLLN
jgi:hypothetical protein